jgi:hypothetical protein
MMELRERRQHADNDEALRVPDETNHPRCDRLSRPDGGRCRAQASGVWLTGLGGRVLLCDDCREAINDSAGRIVVEPWVSVLTRREHAAIGRRIERMSAGYFG